MKQKDILIIVAVVMFSGILAAVASNFLIKPADKKQQVEVVEPISADFPTPDTRFFNADSLDPVQPIQIGNNSNNDPFKDTGQ